MYKLKNILLITICIISVLCTQITVLANEEKFPSNNTISQSLKSQSNKKIINNGETAYFINEVTDAPFLFLGDSKTSVKLEFGDTTYCEVGITDSIGFITSKIIRGEKNVSLSFDIPKTSGKYKVYIRSYNLDSLIINDLKVTAGSVGSTTLKPGKVYMEVVDVWEGYLPYHAILSTTEGYVGFSIANAERSISSKMQYGNTCILNFSPLPKGSYILGTFSDNLDGSDIIIQQMKVFRI